MEIAKYMNEKRVSKFTGIAVQTLRNWRQGRKGFPCLKVGRAVRYSVTDVVGYMETSKVKIQGV